MRVKLRTLYYQEENITILTIQSCMAKTVRSPSRYQGVTVQVSSILYEKHQLLMIRTNLKFTNLSKKAMSIVEGEQTKEWYQSPPHSNIQTFRIYVPVIILFWNIESDCLRYCASISQDCFILQNGLSFIKLK